ncbi:hypothetical protein [uncultured Maribacter sp.]|uniref:hypothetical protein n=1 Tax=uncultured Maribacter sp. TaxID=431308 RepID=UPI0026309052|nr:hypothetical protein [uncultured Maribacter sp.]
MKIMKDVVVIVLFLISFYGFSQDCTLDIGGGNTEVLISVFQLNANQVAKLEALQGEFKVKAKASQDEMDKLLEKHPQSSPEELTKLGEKYSVLEQNLVNLSRAADKEFLKIFNEKQYNRYLELCREAIRKPIVIKPIIYNDSISPR